MTNTIQIKLIESFQATHKLTCIDPNCEQCKKFADALAAASK